MNKETDEQINGQRKRLVLGKLFQLSLRSIEEEKNFVSGLRSDWSSSKNNENIYFSLFIFLRKENSKYFCSIESFDA